MKIRFSALEMFHAYRQTDEATLTGDPLDCDRAYKRVQRFHTLRYYRYRMQYTCGVYVFHRVTESIKISISVYLSDISLEISQSFIVRRSFRQAPADVSVLLK
jgi:hypothetical protein